MKLKHFYLGLKSEDYYIPNPPGSEYPYSVDTIVSDFNFQTDYFTHFIEMKLRTLKYDTDKFNTVMIRARKLPELDYYIQKAYKSLTLEVSFNEEKYKELYPYRNEYPLDGRLLHPIEKEEAFHTFSFDMVMEGLDKGKLQKAPIPYDFLVNTVLDFKLNGFKNEWVYKTKAFKEYGITATLLCKLTMNYFSLELIIEKDKKEVFRKEILKTLPSSLIYKGEFDDIIIDKGILRITKDTYEPSYLYEIDLSDLISGD